MQKQRFLKKLGKRLIELRTQKGFSQTDLANACGKDPQSLERVENGKINPSVFYINELADALEVPLHEFFRF